MRRSTHALPLRRCGRECVGDDAPQIPAKVDGATVNERFEPSTPLRAGDIRPARAIGATTLLLESRTITRALWVVAAIATALGVLALLADRGIVTLAVGDPGYSPMETAITSGLVAMVCVVLAALHRRGIRPAIHVGVLLLSLLIVIRSPGYAFERGIPQVIWIGPMVAFAMTSLRFSIVTTVVTWLAIVLVHGSHGAYHEPSPYFVTAIIAAMLVAGKVRHLDILESERAQADAAVTAALYDSLTGLPNRRLVTDRLEEAVKFARRSQRSVGVLFVDLDRFKAVNEMIGHEHADHLLIEVARRIRTRTRGTDTVARFGADVFAVLLSDVGDRATIDRVGADIVAELSQSFVVAGNQLPLTASVGIAMYPDDGHVTDILLQRANQALNVAKSAGGNRLSYFTSALQEAAEKRLRISQDLRVALSEGELTVFYQPIVDLRTGGIHKAEALVRWNHPTLGLVSPALFIPIAESTGLINELGDWVFEQAVAQVKSWRVRFDAAFQISVNRSPLQFLAAGTRDASTAGTRGPSWDDRLRALDVSGDGIALEITEGLLLESNQGVAAELEAVRNAGMSISLDDFGTGYSSLAYLQRHPIDVVKIDRAFVRGLTVGSKNHALCRAIVTMAHDLGMKVVAEGVETETERDLLRDAGCDFAQGYLFGKAVPPAEFEAALTATA